MTYCESSLDQMVLLKKAVQVPLKDLLHSRSPQFNVEEISEACEDGNNIRRVFIHNDRPDALADVGWVHNEEIGACLNCNLEFGFFRWKHHCRTCGNLVCMKCISPGIIQSHVNMGLQIVCNDCFGKGTSMGIPTTVEEAWGQSIYRSSAKAIHRDLDEVRDAPLTYQCEAVPGFVIQTHRTSNSQETVYINVFHHNSIRDFSRSLTHVDGKTQLVEENTDFAECDESETECRLSLLSADADALDMVFCMHNSYFASTPVVEKVTPLVYLYGPCSVQGEGDENAHFLYNVLVSSAYFDEDLVKDREVLITHGTSVNKIIQLVNNHFHEFLETETFSLPTVARGYLGGVPPAGAHYTRSSSSVYCIPDNHLYYTPITAFPTYCVSNTSDKSEESLSFGHSDSGKSGMTRNTGCGSGSGSGGSLRTMDGFSERITRNYSDDLKALSVLTPDTLLRCEIVYPSSAALPNANEVNTYVIIDYKHTPFRGTMFRLWNVHTMQKKWVKLKRSLKSAGNEFYVTRKFLGSEKEYNFMHQP